MPDTISYIDTTWRTGHVITEASMKNINDALVATTQELNNAIQGQVTQNREHDTLSRRIDGMVKYFFDPNNINDDELQYTRFYASGDQNREETQNPIIVPTLDEYLTFTENFKKNFAEPYSKNKAYSAKQYIEYDANIYKVIAPIAAETSAADNATAWNIIASLNPSPIEKINILQEFGSLIEEFSDLKSAFSTDLKGYYQVSCTVSWNQGGIYSQDGRTTSLATRIRTSNIRGTCDCLAIYAPQLKVVGVYAYNNARTTEQYLGMLTPVISTDQNGLYMVPMTKGMVCIVVIANPDDSNIDPESGNAVSIWQCYMPRETNSLLSGGASAEQKIIGRMYPWVLGGIVSSSGVNGSSDYTIRTDCYIPVTPGRKLKFTGNSTETTSAFVYFYSAETADEYMYRKILTEGDVSVPPGAAYMRFTYGNTSASGIKVTNGMENVMTFSMSVYDDTFSEYLKRIGFISFNVKKGFWQTNGTISTNTTAICSSTLLELPIGQTVKAVISDPHWVYTIKQSDTTTGLQFTERAVAYSEFEVTHKYTAIMLYKKDDNGEYIDLSTEDFDGNIMFFVNDYSTKKETFVHDIPENIGVLNTINRSYQMAKLSYAPVANIPTQVNSSAYPHYVPEGTQISGVMYSSVRDQALYVPQCVSIQTYMTALLNENSYIYTKTEPEPHYNGLTYYGAVCSSMVGWCYGIDDAILTTISFSTYPGMEVIENQSPYGLKLGDMLNDAGSHIEIVTDIVKNSRGIIQWIELTDQVNFASHPWTRRRQVKPSYVQNMITNQGYVAMRYHYIYRVPYTPSNWINLDDETGEPQYNHNLSPRRGENANWRLGETIEIDVTDGTGYTGAKLYKDDTPVSTDSIPANALLVYTGLAYGSYKVCLTDGTNDSDFVYFNIIDTNETFTPLGNKQVKVEYESANGTPASVSFCGGNINDNSYRGVLAFHILTDEEITAGEVTLEAPSTDTYLMKVMYKTEFGLYSGDLTSVVVS